MAASVSDGSAATSHQELETLLAAEGGKDCRFDRHPVSVALGISLLEIANTPPDILPGPIPDNVFVEGLKVPGLVLGVKESRARQKLLLCFGNDEDRNSSLAHLKSVQRTSKPLFNSFSGHHCKPSLPLAIERREKQAMLCYPLAVDYGESLLPDTWKRQNPPAMVTVHVWNVAMDVLDARVARSRDALKQHFKPFCQHAAIVLLTPAKESTSTVVTVSVADKESANYLMKQASALSRFGYFKFVSSQEAVVEAPILVAVREMRRNLVVKVQASEGEDLMTAKLVAEKARSSRVHTSILLRLLHQKQPWHLCLAVKDILYEDKPDRRLYLRQDSGSGLRQLVVPFHQSDVSRFVMSKYWDTVEKTIQMNGCKFHSSYPKLDGLHGGGGGIKLIVIESSSVEGLHRAKADIDALAARISRRLVRRRIPLHMTDLQLLLEKKIPYTDPRYYVRMPSIGYVHWLGLCHADVKLRVDGQRDKRSVTIEACKFSNIHKAIVDVLVVFMNWRMMPTSGDAASVVRDGRSTVTEEINAHYESGRHAQRGQPAALSSGCLNCKAILCSSIPGRHRKEPWSKLKEILATCRQMGAKTIAVAQAGNADSQTWFSALCNEVVQDVLTGGSLERVVTSLRPKSENTLQFASGSLQTALVELRNRKGKDIMSFDIVQDKPIAPLQRCYLPTTCVITAETSKDLDGAEEKMTAFLNAALQERVVPCSSVQCPRVVQCWRNCHMDMKVGCRLRLWDTNSHEITVRGPPSLLDSAVAFLEALIDELIPTSDDSSTAESAELGIGMDDRSHDAGFAEQERRSPVRELQTSASSEEDTDLSIVDFKYGRVRLRRVRGFVCGEYRTGKSNFIRATLGDEFIEGADSTPGVHVERTMVHFDSGSGCEDPFERIPGVAQLFVESMAELAHQKSKQDDSEPGYEATPTVAGPVCGEVATAHFPQLSSTPINGHEPLAELPCMVSAISLEDVGVGSTLVEEPIATSDQSRFSTYPDDSLLHGFLPMESSEFKALEFDQQEKMKAEVRAQLKRIQDLPQDKPVSRTYFEFWDCAGQMTMTTQQSICLDTARSFFVLVFDASKDLNEEVTVEIYRQDGEDIKIPPLFKGMTHRDFILMWLAVIAFRQQQNASASKLSQDAKIRKTTVFLVGTHIDEVKDQDKDSITSKTIDEMEKISRQAGSDNLELKGPYFVDNRRIQDAVVKDPQYNQMVELRKELAKTIESVEEKEMPLSWMMLEDALHLWQECKQSSERATSSLTRHHMTFSFFEELAHYIFKDNSADVKEVLTLFHQLGSVICHDCDHLQDDSLIFLNAEWMLKEFVRLLIFPLQKKTPPDQLHLTPDLDKLRDGGIVSAPLLKAVWSDLDESVRKSIMATMCHFDLACKRSPDTVPGDGGVACSEDDGQSQSYFVPFCLTRDESKADLPTSYDGGDEGDDAQVRPPSLLLKFKTGFFPPPIYSRVAVYCASQFGACGASMEYSAMTFEVNTDDCVHHSRISWSPYGLKLELCSIGEEKEVQTACADLLRAVDDCLEKLKNHQGYAGLSWHLAFPCAHETHVKEVQAETTAMNRLDNWIKIPANWHKKGVIGKKCHSCNNLSKVPVDVKKYWLRSDTLAKVSSNDGATTFVAGEDSRQANVPNPLLPEAAANRMPPASKGIVVNCSTPAPAATTGLLDSAAYKELRLELTETMDMDTARNSAEAYMLITKQQHDNLCTVCEPKGRGHHNRELFRMVEVGGKSALRQFAAKVLSRLGPHFAKMKERLEQLLAEVPADVKTHCLRCDKDVKISGGGSSSSNNIGNDSFVKKASSSKLERDGAPHAGHGSTAGSLATTVCRPNSSTSFGQPPSNPIIVSTSAEGHVVVSGDVAAAGGVSVTINNITDSHVTLGGRLGNAIVDKMSRPAPVQGASHASLNTAGHYLGPPPISLVSEAQIAQLWQSTAVQRCAEDIILSLPTTDDDGVSHFSAADLREMQARSHSRQVLFCTALDQWSHAIGREHVDRVREHFTQVPLPQGVTEAIQRALA